MLSFKFFWTAHKWTGIVLATLFATSACTGFALLIKKRVDWIMPPTQEGAAGGIDDLIPMQRVLGAVIAYGHPDFGSVEDIERVDFRPDKRVHKVHSKHHHAEIQVDAINGDILSVGTRRSDLLEDIHDGSFFGGWVHAWLMPTVAVSLFFMVGSGLWLWIEPMVRRRRRRQRQQMDRSP